MASPFKPTELYDGSGPFPIGINSSVPPILLSRLQASFAANATFRGSYATDRAPYNKVMIVWPLDEVKNAVEHGIWQGGGWYRPDFGASSLFAQISGRLFQFLLTSEGVTVIERTIPGDPNPATTTQVWMWQAENFLIVTDGISLPIFFDGNTTRRSDGFSRNLELSAADWVIPPIGQTVTITLASPYTGPFNRLIYIDGVFYQAVENANASYNVNLTNLTETPGAAIAVGDEVTAQPSKLGYTTAPTTFAVISGSFAVGTLQLNFDISYPYTGALNTDIVIDGKLWRIFSTTNNGYRIQARNRYVVGPPGVNVPAHTLVQLAGSPSPNVELGTVVTGFVAPAQGTSVQVELSKAYTGADGAAVWINDEQWSIEAIPSSTTGNLVTVINIDDTQVGQTRGPTGTATAPNTGQLSTVDELPPGRMGAYGMGRNVMSLVDGQSYIISDIVGGGSGTAANDYRDAVLKITENVFELGGGVFRIPGSAGDIRAIIFPAVLDGSYLQGPCQILTPERCFSVNVPVDRTTWQTVTNPIQSVSLVSNGGQGQNSTITVDGDVQFRSVDGWRSLVFGRRQFTDPGGNSPMSHEVDRIIQNDNKELLAYGSAVYFDGRVTWTASPLSSAQGVIHPALVVQNLESLASINDKSAPFYDGLASGLNVLQLIAGRSLGTDRCFAFSLNLGVVSNITGESLESKIELYELLPIGFEHFDSGHIPITWFVEGPALFLEDPAQRKFKQLVDGEIQVHDVQGRVDFRVSYKPDQYPCWVPWHSWSICATQGEGLNPGFYPRIGFGEPTGSLCDSFTNRPFREFYNVQVRVEVVGHCQILAVNIRAVTQPEPKMAPFVPSGCGTMECKQLECTNPVDYEVYSLANGMIFVSGVLSAVAGCPEGYSCLPGTAPHTFTYPDGTFTIPVPPRTLLEGGELRLDGCQSSIIRFVTPGMTAAQIAALAQEMFAEAAQQQADCDMVNQPGVTRNPTPSSLEMTDLTPTAVCMNAVYSGTTTSNTANTTFSIIGTLPTGLTLSQDGTTATISGTATVAGTYPIAISATVGSTTIFQQVNLRVLGFTTASALPDGGIGTPYSETLATTGLDSPTFSVTSGSLPTGLSLNTSTGEISGTPIEDAGTFTFTVSATDAHASCSQQFTITVPGVDYSQLVWSLQTQQQDGTGVATWLTPGAGGTGATWSALTSATIAPGTDVGRLIIRATMVYAGPNFAGQVRVTVSNNNQVFLQGGNNASAVQFFIDNIIQASASMAVPPPTFNGVYTMNFTASAGVLLFVIDMLSSNPTGAQGNPLTLAVSGDIINV